MKATTIAAFALISHFCAPLAVADTVAIGYPPDHTTTSGLFPGLGEDTGDDVVPRLGQTFKVPDAGHPFLNTFSFWLSDSPFIQPQPTVFDAILMEYGTDRPVGEVIYQSSSHSTLGLAHGERRRFDFHVDAMLDPLANYVFFLDTAPYLDGVPSYALFASDGADVYSDGYFVYSDFSTGQATDNPWEPGGLGWDVIFRAEFQHVPETSSVTLLIVAGVTLTGYRRRAHIVSKKQDWQGTRSIRSPSAPRR